MVTLLELCMLRATLVRHSTRALTLGEELPAASQIPGRAPTSRCALSAVRAALADADLMYGSTWAAKWRMDTGNRTQLHE